MNTSSAVRSANLVLLVAVALSVLPARSAAGPAWIAIPLVAQSSAADTREESDRLLRDARQAMDEGNWETADSLLGRAEKLNAKYGAFHFGDTPKKVRAALNKKRTRDNKPSDRFPPGNLEQQEQRPAETADPFQKQAPLPKSEGITSLDDPKAMARVQIEQARKALAAGDLVRAAHLQHKAAQAAVAWTPDEDSPVRLAADIQQRGGKLVPQQPQGGANAAATPFDVDPNGSLPTLPDRQRAAPFATMDAPPADGGMSDAFAERGAAGLAGAAQPPTSNEGVTQMRIERLLVQARQALAVGDVRRASELIDQAAAMPTKFGPNDDSPDRVAALLRKQQTLLAARQQGETAAWQRAWSQFLLEQADGLLESNQLIEAERLANDAARMPVTYAPSEAKPADVLARIAQRRRGIAQPTAQPAAQAVYEPNRDPNGAVQASFPSSGGGFDFPEDGATSPLDQAGAPSEFAAQPPEQAPPAGEPFVPPTQEAPQPLPATEEIAPPVDTQSPVPRTSAGTPPGATVHDNSLLDNTASEQLVVAKKLEAELARALRGSRQLRENNPREALEMLRQARGSIETAGIDPVRRQVLLARSQSAIDELEQYLRENASRIGLKQQNQAVIAEIERERAQKVELDTKIAKMIDEHNKLINEERFAEAEAISKKLRELAPENPTVLQLNLFSKFVRRNANNKSIASASEQRFLDALESVDEAGIPFDDRQPYSFGDPKKWAQLTKSRKELQQLGGRRSEKEIEIEKRLKTKVPVQYKETPLAEVMQTLGKLSGISIHLDPQGLGEEGVPTDTPITIELSEEVSLASALKLILDPLSLGYVISDEVLKITSAELKNGEVYTISYPVADLVIPIPNFLPTQRMGLAAELHNSYESVGFGAAMGGYGAAAAPLAVVASRDGKSSNASLHPHLLGQLNAGGSGMNVGSGGGGSTMPQGFGPGGMGGGAQADFDSLIQLITSTIQPDSWDEVGGRGSVQPFRTNLSLVVSQTQEVHEEIVDLLEQLRRLQDLQVTIEVRFITLNDNFFERIGVDFDFDINDNTDRPFQTFGNPDPSGPTPRFTTNGTAGVVPRDLSDRDGGPSVTVGRSSPDLYSTDLDIPFRQGSFGLAIPQFGGFDPAAGAQFGFAILSEVEAYFFVNAAQGDRRSNVLQAPKVTLFNGQTASVSDTSQSPFVISVIPVVGDFAAAQQPVIVVLSEGTFLTVQAVVSSDRRFVRLTVVPFFSQIGEVNTFTFTGSTTTTEESASSGPDDDTTGREEAMSTTTSGTTVQLPTFSFVTVSTTVSVPDGGTVLLGGIKRLSEGRNEFGVPLLNKLPYINRLFSNVGIGRDTQSLMMMVTPRIIIQEEEELLLGVAPEQP